MEDQDFKRNISFIYGSKLRLVYDHKKLTESVFLFLSSVAYVLDQFFFHLCHASDNFKRKEINVSSHLKQFDSFLCYSH